MSAAANSGEQEQDRIDIEASEWIVLSSERSLTTHEQGEFDTWIAADPRHASAWAGLWQVWETLPALRGLEDVAVATAPMAVTAQPARFTWRAPKAALALCAAIAAVFIGVFLTPSLLQGPAHRFETGVAQTQLLTLEDGSQVTLGPRSRLEVAFVSGERRVTLAGGEAFFEVTHDRDRPFFVAAGASTTRVVGTKFDVNYAPGSVRVAVLEGLVQVARNAQPKAPGVNSTLLHPGQRAEMSLANAGGISVSTLPPAAMGLGGGAGAWREGRLTYDNARLGDLIADVNRYYAPGVTMADETLADLRVTASFKASEIPAFMSAVGNVVPVRAIENGNGSFRLEPAG